MAGFTTWIGAGRRRLVQKWTAAFISGIKPSIAPIAAWFKLPPGIRTKGLKRKLLVPPKIPSTTAATPGTSPAVLPAFTPARIRKRRRKLGIQPLSAATIVARVQPQYPSWWAPKAFRTDFRRTLRRLLVPPSMPATPASNAPVSAWAAKSAFRSAQNRRLQLVRPAPSTPLAPSIAPVTAWQQPRKFTQTWKFRLLKTRDHASFPATPPVSPQPLTAWLRKEAFKRHGWRDLLKLPELDRYAPTPVHPIAATPAVFSLVRRVTAFCLRRVLHLPSYPQAPVPPQPYTAWRAKTVFRRHGWRANLEPLELDVRPETPVSVGGPMGRSTGVRLSPPDRGARLAPTKRGTKGTQH